MYACFYFFQFQLTTKIVYDIAKSFTTPKPTHSFLVRAINNGREHVGS